jgi:hypothetical protein
MGKLAERFTDAARSGVYRVRAAGVPRAAAGEAQAQLIEVGATALVNGGWRDVQRAIEAPRARTCVLLVPDGAALAQPAHAEVLDTLRAAALTCRDVGRPFFAVLVDPDARLGLPLLYHEAPAP